ncbi:MAG: FAD-dependent oxidoreductase [Deltaproteobacteria bacterium]|nr:FAD-dependent oxidoreductase [Deltaproteobacteria bacterium]
MANVENKKTGAVLVQGGGIAGVQASLDLANSGFKVYLVERSPAIGGMMSLLDKTFPTGDCATCISSPKFVECARNLNIEILTCSELMKIEGDPGHFTVTVKKYPRYVDESICNDCGDCYSVCPVEIKDRFNRDLGMRKAIAKYSPQALPNIAGIIKLGHAPCKIACPAHINVQGYIQLIKKREYVKAVNLIRERNPLSAICGRICTHPCETVCTRNRIDSAVAIRQLKRFASDKEMEMVESGEISLPVERSPSPDARKVAVIGAGPSGLTAADDLADRGYHVTVFEASSAAGGMLRWGIPEYRLPAKILDYEVELIRRKGVSFVFNCSVGTDITIEKLREENEAVYIGIGAQKSVSMNVKGEGIDGVIEGLEFLHNASLEDAPVLKGHVIVVGGGDVAMDAACSAIRLGADKVSIVYRRSETELPAIREEINHAVEEGVNFKFLTAPVEFMDEGSGRLRKVKCIRMKLGEPDDSGRRRPEPIEGSEFEMEADTVILAIGSQPDHLLLDSARGLSVNKWGNITTDKHGATDMEGVFAGGDIVTGPATVIDAVAAGKRAAESIAIYLSGKEADFPRFEDTIKPVPEELLPSIKNEEEKPRAIAKELSVQRRIKDFAEIETAFSEPEALSECERCLNCAICSECGECVDACEKKAIDLNMEEEEITLEVGSVILAPGFEEMRAEVKGEFGFGRYENVVTSVQFERLLSAAGPTEGHVLRQSDGREARSIAFIQCVGSRDSKCGNEYCSSVCCMATTKQAMVAKEHVGGLNVTIFYMDIRAFGKGFDQYYERARTQDGMEYIKSMPSRVVEIPETKDLMLRFLNEKNEIEDRIFDLVVLAVGMDPKPTISKTISRLGIELNEFGFCATDRFSPLETSREGIFVAGAFQEPKDIPETVTQASAAASMSMEMLAESRNDLITERTYPDEHDITDEEPRIGVFVCHCGLNIASVIDVERVAKSISNEPNVIMATHTMFACSDGSLSEIKESIHKHRLNRIVVASCTPRTHEPLFRETLRESGLNPYLFELANIRDQCSWVHASEPEAANDKAIELVRMSISRARLLRPLIAESMEINQDVLVIGGGLSGMTAALSLAKQGFRVNLVERTNSLGGHLRDIRGTLEHDDISGFTDDLICRVSSHPYITLHMEANVKSVNGHIGDFVVRLSERGENMNVSCGAIIIATGAAYAETGEFLYNDSDNVLTQLELEEGLHDKSFNGANKNIVMIQCVGSRNSEREYCSRICCSMAIKNALKIKEQHPDSNIYILYRDIRTYGFRELYYKKAREKGVVFIRYDEKLPPVVSDNNGLLVRVDSPDFPETIEIEVDNVILSTGVDAPEDNRLLADMLKVSLNADGFFNEAHLKLRPVEFANEGVFLCGLAHSPKFIDENISQARASAARVATVLSKSHLEASAQVSHVDQSKCISCMTCVKVCPYGAPFVNHDNKAQITAAKCMGCGICASECPARAIQLSNFESKQFNVMLDSLFQPWEAASQ